MNEPINLAEVTDVTQLKALAYDCLANIEQLQGQLQAINNRIAQLSQET